MKISAVLIVKNEEALLARCLESVKEADEIIICDTGSTEKTIEVAKQFTDKVFTDFVWCDSFEKARNHAKSKATGDYILSIDADEYCLDFSKVRKAVESGQNAIGVNMLPGHPSGAKFEFPRLFKNIPEIWWEGAIHNHLNVSMDTVSDIEIVYDYSPAHEQDPDRALRILEKQVQEAANPREMYYLGREYWYKQNYRSATAILGKYVQIAYWFPEQADAFLIMARCYWAQGLGEDARDACMQAIKINPHFKEALLFMSELCGPDRGNEWWDAKAKQWLRMAEMADNSNVLFIRE